MYCIRKLNYTHAIVLRCAVATNASSVTRVVKLSHVDLGQYLDVAADHQLGEH